MQTRSERWTAGRNWLLAKTGVSTNYDFALSGEYYDSNTDILLNILFPAVRLTGSLSENGHPLPILVEAGKTVGNIDLMLHEDPRDWVPQHAVLLVIAAVAILTLITYGIIHFTQGRV